MGYTVAMTNTRYTRIALSVCGACTDLLAIGQQDDAQEIARLWGATGWHLVCDGAPLGRSRDDCDGCGEELPGERYRAFAAIPCST